MMKKRLFSLVFSLVIVLSYLCMLPTEVKAATTYYWPVEGHTGLSQGYRPPENPNHDGIDIWDSSIKGANVRAAIGGTVYLSFDCASQHVDALGNFVSCKVCEGFGTGLVILGEDEKYYAYAHMQAGSIPDSYTRGEPIPAGAFIGRVGNTGYSKGDHLHFSICTTDPFNYIGNVNPMTLNYTYGSSYLEECTRYPSSGKVEITGSVKFWTLPCSDSTEATSQYIYTPTVGSKWEVTAIWENTAGNYWYETKYDGKTLYFYSKNATHIEVGETGNITLTDLNVPSNLGAGNSFLISGLVSSSGWELRHVGAYIYKGTLSLIMPHKTSKDDDLYGKNYQLSGSNVANGLHFEDLSEGTYTLRITASAETYVAGGNTLNISHSDTVTLHQSVFTVDTHTHNFNTYVDYLADHPHYKRFSCSCGEITTNYSETVYVASCAKCQSNTAVELSWSVYADKHWVGTTNAVLAARCDMSIPNTVVSKCGIYLYDYSGNQLATTIEPTSFAGANYFNQWYDVNSELGYQLQPGTPYKYKFFLVINEKDVYISKETFSFTTGGTHTHSYNNGTVTQSPTCGNPGVKIYTCTTCGGTKAETLAQLTNHIYSNNCDTVCNFCGAVRTITHSYNSGVVTQAATCNSAGVKTYTCSVCSATKTESIPKLSTHTPGAAATCTNAQTCAVCGKVLIEKLGHTPGVAATCTEDQTCTVCGQVLEGKLGHTPGAATCTEDQTCTVCGEVLAEKLGHTPGAAATASTPQTCTVCGAVLVEAGLTFQLNNDGQSYSIADCNTSVSGNLVIPATYNGLPVTIIGNDAFLNCCSLTSVTIPDSVTSIGTHAFSSCESLKNITIPNSVTSIGNDAFSNCESLKNVTIPDSVTSIGYGTFFCCKSLTQVTLSNSVTSIGDLAFYHCSNLVYVTYCGTEEQWNAISIGSYNGVLTNAERSYHNWQDATCTAPKTCTICGDTEGEALGHSYITEILAMPTFTATGEQQKVCSACGDTVTELLDKLVAKVHQWNIALQDDYAVNFNLQISESIESTAKVRLTVGDETATYSVSELKKTADGYFRLTANISAVQMNDFITVMVTNGREIGSNTTYTVRQYCDTILANESYSQYHPLVKEMLNYGAMAQIYFDYDTEYLANDGITGVAATDVPKTAEKVTVSDQISNVNFYGASLVYRDRIAVRYYFTGDVADCTFTANGNTYTPVAKDGMHYVEIADILPQDLDRQITLTVTGADGNVLTVSYSPMNYIVRMNEKGSDTLKALVKALYNYHLAAKALST